MAKKKTELIEIKKGKLPSKKVLEEYSKLRKSGFSPKISDKLSRVKFKI